VFRPFSLLVAAVFVISASSPIFAQGLVARAVRLPGAIVRGTVNAVSPPIVPIVAPRFYSVVPYVRPVVVTPVSTVFYSTPAVSAVPATTVVTTRTGWILPRRTTTVIQPVAGPYGW
jgi:hypothetical protein